ncbi:MAG: ABC transporter ATP-binding protein [Roseiarcus sp.]|jgi:molybdate/tungstate transport system ATP-binding protein
MTDAALAIERASLTLGQFSLRAIDLELEAGEIMVLLGPNGAGKSVCLELIAGFHRASSGRILIHGREVTDLPPEQRRVGLVFQNFGLFPHYTVAGNVSLGLRARRGAGRTGTARNVGELLSRFGVAHLSDRYPQDLSPGEKQRVALARALATQPDLFLFDEPFSALDARTRVSLREDLKAFLRHSGMPAIFVSHDQTDAALLADRVAVMNRGEILQVGAVSDIFGKPVNAFVAEFTGVENILTGRLSGQRGDLRRIEVADAVLHAPGGDFAGGEALLCLRAEEVGLRPGDDAAGPFGLVGATNRLSGKVVEAVSLGAITKVTVDCGFVLVARLTNRQARELALAPGREVIAEIEADSIHLLKPDAADRIAVANTRQANETISIPHPWRSAAQTRG